MTKNIDNVILQTKARERTVKTQGIEYDLETLVKKIGKNLIKLDPDYQRNHRWNNTQSSKLIESLILNIPIPVIYLSYDIDVDDTEEWPRYSVIDWQQRLTAIRDFFEDKYSLTGLDILSDLEGLFYKDLPAFLIRRLEERTIKCLRIDSTLDAQVKYDIFERLNSWSVKLEPHELRNAINRGPFNDKCKILAKDENFRALLQISPENIEWKNSKKVEKMQDIELVLRFFSLINDSYSLYKKTKDSQFQAFLSQSLTDKNQLPTAKIDELWDLFKNVMKIIRDNFWDFAFAKYKFNKWLLVKQSNFNAAVYDALSVAVASEVNLSNPKITHKQIEKFKNLFKNPDFFNHINGAILDSARLIGRITLARNIFK